jgi:hypothetical protein
VSQPKQILYRYYENKAHDELADDLDGSVECMTGTTIHRMGKAWKIEDAILTQSKGPTELPILTVFLTDKSHAR